jgi:uncharacterized membrane protein YkvA (DUF1232 family)
MALVALLRVFKAGTPGLGRRLGAIPRMLAATLRGDYDGRARIVMMAVVGVYLFSPLEFMADVVFLIVGLVGNAGVAAWLVGALMDETERFLEWERQRHLYARAPVTMPVVPPGGFHRACVGGPGVATAVPVRSSDHVTDRQRIQRRRQ